MFPLQTQTLFVFGDSNVAGWRPDAPKLFGKTKTWPRLLGRELGPEVRVLVDGLPGRALENAPGSFSTDLAHFSAFLESGHPKSTDTLVLMIGVNDLPLVEDAKTVVERVNTYAARFRELAREGGEFRGRVLYVVHPGIVQERIPDSFSQFRGIQAVEGEFLAIVDKIEAELIKFDQSLLGQDGIHLSETGHAELARLLAGKIGEIRGSQ